MAARYRARVYSFLPISPTYVNTSQEWIARAQQCCREVVSRVRRDGYIVAHQLENCWWWSRLSRWWWRVLIPPLHRNDFSIAGWRPVRSLISHRAPVLVTMTKKTSLFISGWLCKMHRWEAMDMAVTVRGSVCSAHFFYSRLPFAVRRQMLWTRRVARVCCSSCTRLRMLVCFGIHIV